MGYDLMRFVGAIDEEFQCAICTMVLEVPLQSACDHLFCSKCIKQWLTVNESCPVDRRTLTSDNLKPPARYFLNMLDKLDIKCSFQPQGCETVTKLEHLKNHLTNCKYSPNLEIICDKGCNLSVKRSEYQLSCIAHLTNRLRSQDEKIYSFNQALNGHFCQQVIELKSEVSHLQAQVSKLSRDVVSQRKCITKLNDELKREKEIQKLNIGTPSIRIPQWQKTHNMNVSIDQPNILEFGHNSGSAFAQSLHPLILANYCFKIHILSDCGHNSTGIGIGLTQKGHPTDVPPGHSDGSIGYRCSGELYYDKCASITSHACKVNDIVECGIKFSKNFVNDGNRTVVVYFSKNGLTFLKKMIRIPLDGLFPTIYKFDVHLNDIVKIKCELQGSVNFSRPSSIDFLSRGGANDQAPLGE